MVAAAKEQGTLIPPEPRSTLGALAQELGAGWANGLSSDQAAAPVFGVSADTRTLQPGELFVAVPGDKVDGADFVERAVELGCSAVVVESADVHAGGCVPVLHTDDARLALSRLSAAYWGRPSRELKVVGITGTDGKTTTTYMTSAVLGAAGGATGFISTTGVKIGAQWSPNAVHITTPFPPDLHRALRAMVDAGIEFAVVESSSHGLRLARLADVEYDVAVLTNVTSEHLELHGTLEQYRLDKAKLFAMLGRSVEKGVGKTGVVNADDPHADLYLRATAGRTLTYGTYRHADVVAERVVQSADGLRFNVSYDGSDPAPATLTMLGPFNVYNALAALCAGLALGVPLADGLDALARFEGVPGRMQRVDEGQPFGVVVDYTHTAKSLEAALRTLRPLTLGRLIVVFGSAGERDTAKRPEMGRVAAVHADELFLTNEDPRGEDERQILREIAAGAQLNRTPTLIPSRREAIYEAFRSAVPGDMILLAGKGHESSIEFSDHTEPWNEVEVARELLRLL